MSDLIRRGTKSLMRDINNSRVLQLIQAHAPISRAEIAKMADLQPPTVTAIVNDFLRAGLVRETDTVREAEAGNAALGRPPILLSLNDHAAFALGVKLRGEGLTVAVTDLGGTVVHHSDRMFDTVGPDAALRQVATEVQRAISAAGVGEGRVLGLGIGMPGLIDHASGVCRHSPLLGWRNVDVKAKLESLLDLPVYADNDVNMLTAAEIAYGAGREVSEFLTVTIGRGIGLGIVVRGEIYRGFAGGAGEFGHTKVGGSLRCDCGAVGCLEAVASETGMRIQIAQALGRTDIDVEEAIDLAERGNESIREIMSAAGRTLGTAIGNLVNLFNPQRVIVTGEGTRAGSLMLDPMRSAISSAAFAMLGTDTQIIVQRWGDEAWARGAASIAVHEMLKSPVYRSGGSRPLDQILDRGALTVSGRR